MAADAHAACACECFTFPSACMPGRGWGGGAVRGLWRCLLPVLSAGPVLAFVYALRELLEDCRAGGTCLPCNIVFLVEGEEENVSREFVRARVCVFVCAGMRTPQTPIYTLWELSGLPQKGLPTGPAAPLLCHHLHHHQLHPQPCTQLATSRLHTLVRRARPASGRRCSRICGGLRAPGWWSFPTRSGWASACPASPTACAE